MASLSLLVESRREKVRTIKGKENRSRSIAAGLLLRHMLMEEQIPYAEESFGLEGHGKPRLKKDGVFFNLSHAGAYVAGVLSDVPVGVDVEQQNRFLQETRNRKPVSYTHLNDKRLLGIGFDGIVAACGNHVEMDGKVLYENILSPELTEKIVRVMEECRMPIVLEGPDCHWIDKENFRTDPYVLYLFEAMGASAKILKGYSPEIRINKMSGDILPTTDYKRVRKELDADFDCLEHEGHVVEFVPKGTSKATGIDWLCRHMGIKNEDTYAIGDSVNDLDMLSFVGHGIAMGNGCLLYTSRCV